MMIPPFKHGEFIDMRKKEVQQYFDWYISQVNYRINVLNEQIEKEGLEIVLDYSADSLIPLW